MSEKKFLILQERRLAFKQMKFLSEQKELSTFLEKNFNIVFFVNFHVIEFFDKMKIKTLRIQKKKRSENKKVLKSQEKLAKKEKKILMYCICIPCNFLKCEF